MNIPSVDTKLSQAESAARSPARLRISECFVSRQGEGSLTGTTSSFIRLDGCNLRCWFCDTPYASWNPDGSFQSLAEVVSWVKQAGPKHVVLTGGEPLLPIQVVTLCQQIQEAGLHLTIETAGTIDRPVRCDLLSLSPKLSRSAPNLQHFPEHVPVMAERWIAAHHRRRWQPAVIAKLIAQAVDYQFKFVIDHPDEQPEILTAVTELNVPADRVWIMPQAITPEQLAEKSDWVSQWSQTQGFHFCDRAHLKWYGAKRGT